MLEFDPPRAYVNDGTQRIALDAPAATAFISHAHSDHCGSLKRTELLLASQQTTQLLKAKGKEPKKSAHTHKTDSVEIALLNAGHILGSKMLYAEGENTFLYTGDFLSEDSLTQKAAVPVEADTLLLECTYGAPEYSFPPRETAYDEMGKWARAQLDAGKIAVVGAYALGKAQEVVAALNLAGITPAVSPEVAQMSKVYVENGVRLEYSAEGEALNGAFAAVVPMHHANRHLAEGLHRAYGRKVSVSVATGWALNRNFNTDRAFCLSDHNDFEGLVKFVEACAPKKVYCTHGFADVFAAQLRKKGFDAHPLEKLGEKQRTLAFA